MMRHVVLIGAGSASFARGLVADVIQSGRETTLALVDIDAAALCCVERLSARMIEAKNAPIKLLASTDRRQVLSGATAVICTIAVGGRRAWEQDVFIPRQHGIYQPVGDTIMPGGLSRALRMIPAMVEIARDVLDLCPDAVFANYSNPMSAVCRGVRKATGAEVIGLCHGVLHVGQYLADFAGIPRDEVTSCAAGINHLTWFTEFRHRGRDAWPLVHRVLAEKTGGKELAEAVDHPFTWQLFELFGAFPAVLDRHITEFFPHLFPGGRYFGKTLGVDAFSFEGTIAHGDKAYAEMQEQAEGKAPLPEWYFRRSSGEHEQVIEIIEAIESDTPRVFSANLANRGQVPNLPEEAVVESPAVATAAGLRPLTLAPLPAGVSATLVSKFQVIEAIVDAALTGDAGLFTQALLLDGAAISVDSARSLAEDLLTAHAQYLPQFNRKGYRS